MTSGTWSHEVEAAVPADKLFKAAIVDWHNVGPKILPEIIASGAPIAGEGAAGSIRQLKFTPAVPFGYVNERLDFIDHEKFEAKNTLVEGGDLGTKLVSLSTHFKIEPAGNGGCVVKIVATYEIIPGAAAGDEISKAKEGITGMIKATEAYLVANPTAYA